jgi:group I intron endonuclease
MKGIIYKLTCNITGKVYIGKTCRGLNARIRDHIYAAKKNSQYHIHRAIRKYGINNFKFEELIQDIDTELDNLEKQYIKLYNSKEEGYNLTEGGEGTLGRLHTEEFKQNMSKRTKGELNPNYGRHHTEESKKKISSSHNWKGKKQKPESIYKSVIAKGGKPFIIMKDNVELETFISIRECARKYNLDNSCIAKCLKNMPKYKTVKQYKFKYI